jgi:hypothetical protein
MISQRFAAWLFENITGGTTAALHLKTIKTAINLKKGNALFIYP